MNCLVVRQIAAGLAEWLGAARADGCDGCRVVVGRDARNRSEDFAAATSEVLADAGVTVDRIEPATPTPVVAWWTRVSGADAGVVCTASHNPPEDNGVKLYLRGGAQPVPPDDTALASVISSVADTALSQSSTLDTGPARPVTGPGGSGGAVRVRVADDVVDRYASALAGLVRPPAGPLRLVHTALHGVAWDALRALFQAAGYPTPIPTPDQAEPDPGFPTTPMPNPEEPGALDHAVALAVASGADAVLASDPDGDRLGVAVPAPAAIVDALGPSQGTAAPGWVRLSGDQLGWLLARHRIDATAGDDRFVVSTIETSQLLARLAARQRIEHVVVPTGFKWIAHAMAERNGSQFVFGYEQALGFAVHDQVHDKDGLAAALVFAELLAVLRASGATVWDALEELARDVGLHSTATRAWRLPRPDRERIDRAMRRLRAEPPTRVAGLEVVSVVDLATPTGWSGPPVDAVVLQLADDARLVARPSGTEPKLKAYAEVVGALGDGEGAFAAGIARNQADADRLAAGFSDWLAESSG
jgi:phosphomannomutase